MAVVRKDKLLAGYNGNLESAIIYNTAGATKVDATNGVFVVLGALEVGAGREVHKATLGAVADITKEILLVHNPEVMYDERLYKLADFKIDAGKVARCYRLFDGDVITLTADLFSDYVSGVDVPTPYALGDIMEIKLNGKIGRNNASTAKIRFQVIEISNYDLDMKMKAYALKVLR